MQGLRHFRHDEICQVDNVVARVQTNGGEAGLQPKRRRLNGDVVKNQRAVTGAQGKIGNGDLNRAASGGNQIAPNRIAKLQSGDGGDFTGHAEVAPEVGPVGDALVIDFDNAVGLGNLFRAGDLDDAAVIFADFQFRGRGQHAVA